MTERELREQIAERGWPFVNRGYTCGNSGNISARLPDGILISPRTPVWGGSIRNGSRR